ncbi:MAG TPA: hypothetical protein VGL84_02740 [Gaiellaceae bacterium]
MLRFALVLTLAGTLVASAGAASPVRSETATSGHVKATVTYRQLDATHFAMQLTVVRNKNSVYNKPVPTSFAHTGPSQPLGLVGGASTIELGDLDGDGEPEILVNLYTGGAHCCNWTWAYKWQPKLRTYSRTAHVWGDPLYRLADLGHTNSLELVSADDRFAYAFSDYADSVLPVQVWTLLKGRFVDSTHSYANVVTADLATNWRRYQEAAPGTPVRGILAAWVADDCLLGDCQAAYARVRSLSSRLGDSADVQNGSVAAYLTKLKSSLVAWGYWQ